MSVSLTLEGLGTLSAVIIIAGYVQYTLSIVRGHVRPNATMWVLSSIGGLSLLVAEGLYGVPWNGLKADAADVVLAAGIAAMALAGTGIARWQAADRRLLCWYLVLLATYLVGDVLSRNTELDGVMIVVLTAGVILLYNLTTMVEFWPILRETWKNPDLEVPTAWIIWCFGYALQLVVRIGEGVEAVTLIHPLVCLGLHLAMVLLPTARMQRRFDRFRGLPRKVRIETVARSHALAMRDGERPRPSIRHSRSATRRIDRRRS